MCPTHIELATTIVLCLHDDVDSGGVDHSNDETDSVLDVPYLAAGWLVHAATVRGWCG